MYARETRLSYYMYMLHTLINTAKCTVIKTTIYFSNALLLGN